MLLDHLKRLQRPNNHRQRNRIGEQVVAGALPQQVNNRLAAAREAAGRTAERLPQGARQNVYAVGYRPALRGCRDRRGQESRVAWESSTMTSAWWRSASSQTSPSGARSPSMLNTPSVAIRRKRGPGYRVEQLGGKSAMSLCW